MMRLSRLGEDVFDDMNTTPSAINDNNLSAMTCNCHWHKDRLMAYDQRPSEHDAEWKNKTSWQIAPARTIRTMKWSVY
jgi:hypothetical protein